MILQEYLQKSNKYSYNFYQEKKKLSVAELAVRKNNMQCRFSDNPAFYLTQRFT